MTPNLLEDEVITTIANRLYMSPAQVTLAWAVQRGTAFLTTSTNPQRNQSNYDISPLPDDAMQQIRIHHHEHPVQLRRADRSPRLHTPGSVVTSPTRVALVTGASRGIGAATASVLAERGFRVVVNYRSSAEEADDVVRAVTAAGGQAVAIWADVTDAGDVVAMVDETKRRWVASTSWCTTP